MLARPAIPETDDPVIKQINDIIISCWKQNPRERPTIQIIKDKLEDLYTLISGITAQITVQLKVSFVFPTFPHCPC